MTLFDDVLAALPEGTKVLDPAKGNPKPPFVVVLTAGGELEDGRLMDAVDIYCAGAYETEANAERKSATFIGGIVRALNASPVMIVESWTAAESDVLNDGQSSDAFLISTVSVRAPL